MIGQPGSVWSSIRPEGQHERPGQLGRRHVRGRREHTQADRLADRVAHGVHIKRPSTSSISEEGLDPIDGSSDGRRLREKQKQVSQSTIAPCRAACVVELATPHATLAIL